MKAVAVLAVLCAVSVSVVSASTFVQKAVMEKRRVKAQSYAHAVVDATGKRIECDQIFSGCEACAAKHDIGGVLANACYFDHISKTCNFHQREPHYCQGNQGFPTSECMRCKKAADAAQQARQQAATAQAAATNAQAAAAQSAGKAGTRCKFNGGPGICVSSPSGCQGRPHTRTGCMNPNTPVCCGLAVKNSKRFTNDKCNQFNGAKRCWDCLRNGCEMHVSTQLCTNRNSGFARQSDGVVGNESMCYLVAQKRDAARQKVKDKAKNKRK